MDNGIIKSAGRCVHSHMPLNAQRPYFIPNRSCLVDLFVMHLYNTDMHCGLSHTFSLYRLTVTWRMPFSSKGVDHTGHFFYRDNVGLFMCTITRAVHLEVVNDLMTPLFLLCLCCLAAVDELLDSSCRMTTKHSSTVANSCRSFNLMKWLTI